MPTPARARAPCTLQEAIKCFAIDFGHFQFDGFCVLADGLNAFRTRLLANITLICLAETKLVHNRFSVVPACFIACYQERCRGSSAKARERCDEPFQRVISHDQPVIQ